MIWLASGVVLWSGAHLFKRIAPDARARLGNAGRPLMAVLLVASVVLMTLGYQQDSTTVWWGRQTPWVGVNNVLVYLGFYFIAGSQVGARVVGVIRHPQLTAVKLWVVAHLLVNGDSASLILFGGLLVRAALEHSLRPCGSMPGFSGEEKQRKRPSGCSRPTPWSSFRIRYSAA